MPWSEWQDPFMWDEARREKASVVVSRDSTKFGRVSDAHVEDRPLDQRNAMIEDARTDAMSLVTAAIDVNVTTEGDPGAVLAQDVGIYGDRDLDPFGNPIDTATVTLQQRIYYLAGWAGMSTRHHGFVPELLRGGVQGVDFDTIPGVDPDDPDQFVQWEDGSVTEAQAWVGTITGFHGGYTPGSALGIIFDDYLGRNDPTLPAWSQTYPDAVIPNSTGAQQDFAYDFVKATSGDAELAVVLDPGMGEPALTTSSPAAGGFGVQGSFTELALRLLMPRWRYWVPGDVPLRQRQRDDGLGLSSARWRRGRSLQASNRWKGYL